MTCFDYVACSNQVACNVACKVACSQEACEQVCLLGMLQGGMLQVVRRLLKAMSVGTSSST